MPDNRPPCSWPWNEEPCSRKARNEFSILCLVHLSEVSEAFRKHKEAQVVLQTMIDHRGMNRDLGSLNQFGELKAIVDAIFSKVRYFSLPSGTRCKTKIMANGECFAVDHQGRRYIEQNSTKSSAEARRVRKGAQIVWVIQTHDRDGQPMNAWIGKIEDGIVRMK